MKTLIALVIVVAIVGAAICYIVKEKKKGTRCIGCPNAGKCAGACGGEKL